MKIKIIDFGAIERNQIPKRKHYNDAGADIYSTYTVNLYPNQVVKIPLGFGLELPDGYAGYIYPRTSLTDKGVICHLPPIDSGYRGEIHAIVSNLGNDVFHIEEGMRIGQLVIIPCLIAEFVVGFSEERNSGAFGSTGLK